MSTVVIHDLDRTRLIEKACQALFEILRTQSDKHIVVALPGGRSIVYILQEVVDRADDLTRESWDKIEFFMVDERLVPLNDDRSNYQAVQGFLNKLVSRNLINCGQIHPFEYKDSLSEQSVTEYYRVLENYGGLFHAVVLGVGEDGHVAGLFPNHESIFHEGDSFFCYSNSPKPPSARMTASAAMVRRSKAGIALILGEGKRRALEMYNDSDLTVTDCPAKLIDSLPSSFVVTDIKL